MAEHAFGRGKTKRSERPSNVKGCYARERGGSGVLRTVEKTIRNPWCVVPPARPARDRDCSAAVMPARARSLSVVLIDEDGATGPTPRLSGNTKALLMMFVLFTSITAAQWVGGITAHSLALQADCASMGVDALSYVGNILAECQTDRRPSTLTARPSAWHVRPPRLVALRAEAAPSDPLPQQQGHVPQSRFLPVASSSGQAQAESFAAFHCAAGSACASSSA